MDLTKAKQLFDNDIAPLSGKMDLRFYKEAAEQNTTVSRLLEKKDPSQEGDKLDAFQRQFVVAGYQLTSPQHAPTIAELQGSKISHLVPELIRRGIKKGQSMLRTGPHNLIAIEVKVVGNKVQPMYIDNKTIAGSSLGLVGSGAQLPITEVLYREKDVAIKNYGKVVKIDYKIVKNKNTIEFLYILWLIGKNLALDQVTDIDTVIRAGDGTVGACGSTTSSTAACANMKYNDFVDLLIDFDPLFDPNIAFMTNNQAKAFLKLSEIKDPWAFSQFTQKGELPTPFGFTIVRNIGGSDRYLALIDKQFAIIKGVETPLMIEADKIIGRKMDEIAISESICYYVGVDTSRRMLDFQS